MTNKELVALLQQLPADHEVVVSLHSEYSKVTEPKLIEGFDNGGYVSEPRYASDPGKVHGYIYLGPDYGS